MRWLGPRLADRAAPDASSLPVAPPGLTEYWTGNRDDFVATPTGGLILMGGSTDVDAAFTWWKPRIAGGDVVVIRTSGSNGYNEYLFTDIGGADSVLTMLVTSRALADSDYVAHQLEHAEGIFIAGGDQSTYVSNWKGTRLESALMTAAARGAVIGGTSAGCHILGQYVYSALNASTTSAVALANPYDTSITLERDFLALPSLTGLITDTHFSARDRMGRLATFLARIIQDGWSTQALALGIDEATALVVEPTGSATVLGRGNVYALTAATPPETCTANQPLTYSSITRRILRPNDTITLPAGTSAASPLTLSITSGTLSPSNPY